MTLQHHTARALRDIGTQVALDFAGEDWREHAIRLCTEFFRLERVIGTLNMNYGTATRYGVLFEQAKAYAIAKGLEEPPSANAWGAVCLTMSRRGIIVKTGQYANSAGVRSHARANPLWRLA
jgi:hypothetical protein